VIKLIFVFRRAPGLTLEECQAYWRDNHATLVRQHAVTLGIRRYVQVHTVDDPLNEVLRAGRGEIEPYDGMAQLWWSDRDELEASGATAEGRRAAKELIEDERRFIDHSRSSLWLAREHVFIEREPGITAGEGSPVVKMSFGFRRLPGLSLEDCQGYWRDVHGQRVLQQADEFPLRRYAQSHTIQDPLNDALRRSRGTMEPFDGVAEMWGVLEELAVAAATPEGQRAAEEFLADERRFIDATRSSIWLGKEHVIIEG